MAMDIILILVVFPAFTLVTLSSGKDIYLCTWPTNEVIQLRCDYVNCPYLSVDVITVGRLHGNPSSCMEFNSNETTRKPIESCTYRLMESHDFFGQVRNNCSRKQVCDISSEEVFQSAGICGRDVGQLDSIRNWMHIEHSCYGDIPGVKCTAAQTQTTEKPTTTTTTTRLLTRLRRPVTHRPNQQSTFVAPIKTSGVTLIIPILATLLVCTLLLIVATMLYRHGICRRKKSWQETVQDRLNHQRPSHHDSKHSKSQIKIDDLQFKMDSSKLKELEKRLSKNQVMRMNSNEYCHDLSFPNSSTISKTSPKGSLEDVKIRPTSRTGRRSSLDLPVGATSTLPPLPTTEMYYSDTSESTTTTEQEYDSTGRRKRRRVKPLPPLPRPVVPHSEVYFTETETESEAPHRASRRKEPLPKLEPPPKLAKDKPKYDRLRLHKPPLSTELGHPIHPTNRQSLELALTKGAAKKLNIATSHENKVKVTCSKKPVARPRSSRFSTSLYGNILMDENMISPTNTTTANNNVPKRSHTVPVHSEYKNVLNR